MPRPSDEQPKVCASCWFWQPLPEDENEFSKGQGQCRAHAPITGSGEWPETFATDWCGEFKRGVRWNAT